jgi:hypothetical protein
MKSPIFSDIGSPTKRPQAKIQMEEKKRIKIIIYSDCVSNENKSIIDPWMNIVLQ